MVAATSVDVAALGTTPNDIPAGNLQQTLGNMLGKTVYAVEAAGQGKGTADWAAQKLGALHYHLQQIGQQIGYTVPPLEDL